MKGIYVEKPERLTNIHTYPEDAQQLSERLM